LSHTSAPSSVDLGHVFVNQLQCRLPEIRIVMQQLVCLSQIFYLKERSAFIEELLLNSGKRVHAQLPLPSCFLDLVGMVQEMHISVNPFKDDVHPAAKFFLAMGEHAALKVSQFPEVCH